MKYICEYKIIQIIEKYLFLAHLVYYQMVILTYSFQMAAILVLFLICSPVHIHNNRNFILSVNIQIYSCYMLITFLVIMTFACK